MWLPNQEIVSFRSCVRAWLAVVMPDFSVLLLLPSAGGFDFCLFVFLSLGGDFVFLSFCLFVFGWIFCLFVFLSFGGDFVFLSFGGDFVFLFCFFVRFLFWMDVAHPHKKRSPPILQSRLRGSIGNLSQNIVVDSMVVIFQ